MGIWHLIESLWWPQSGKGYAFTSSVGSDLGELAVIGTIWHKLNCHTRGCWRIGRQQVDGTTYVVCRKHHPADKPTPADIHSAARENGDSRD